MEHCSKVNTEVYSPYPAPVCNSTYFATIGKSATFLYQNYSFRLSNDSKENILWVPPNTPITDLKNIYSLNISFIVKTDVLDS